MMNETRIVREQGVTNGSLVEEKKPLFIPCDTKAELNTNIRCDSVALLIPLNTTHRGQKMQDIPNEPHARHQKHIRGIPWLATYSRII